MLGESQNRKDRNFARLRRSVVSSFGRLILVLIFNAMAVFFGFRIHISPLGRPRHIGVEIKISHPGW